MINFKKVSRFCCENISLIENYDKAINDISQTWHCHHRFETDKHMSRDELIDANMYFYRPANELIFLTKSEHRRIHSIGKNNPMYGKNHEIYMTPEAIKIKRSKQSINVTEKKNGRYHTKQMYKDGEYKTVKYEDIEVYLYNGWIIKGRPHK